MKTVFRHIYQIMKSAIGAAGLQEKHEIAEEELRTALMLRRQGEIRHLRGKLNWEGDLDSLRRDRRSSD